jgi:hypothetical protein
MIEPNDLIGAVAFGAAAGALMTLAMGIRRIPWRYAVVVGAGWAIAFAALRAATLGGDPAILVIIGAIGGTLVGQGFERGERERKRISSEITSVPSAPPV